MLLINGHDSCADNDVDNFTVFCRLDHKGHAGNGHPAPVAGVALYAEGVEHSEKYGRKDHQQSLMLGQNLNIQEGQHDKQDQPNDQCDDLLGNIGRCAVIVGGAGNHYDTEDGGSQTEAQQHPVGSVKEFFDSVEHFTLLSGK